MKRGDELFAQISELREHLGANGPESVSVLLTALLAHQPEAQRHKKIMRKLAAKSDSGVPRSERDSARAREAMRFGDRLVELGQAMIREQAFHDRAMARPRVKARKGASRSKS